MNNSLAFIKSRIKESHTYGMPVDGWDNAIVLSPIDFMNRLLGNEIINNNLKYKLNFGNNKNLKVEITYDPNGEFEYFTNESSTYDGTLIFFEQTVNEVLRKLFFAQTTSKDISVKDISENPDKYILKYIIGDLVTHRDFGIKTINGNKMYGETDIVCLPISVKAELR